MGNFRSILAVLALALTLVIGVAAPAAADTDADVQTVLSLDHVTDEAETLAEGGDQPLPFAAFDPGDTEAELATADSPSIDVRTDSVAAVTSGTTGPPDTASHAPASDVASWREPRPA